MPECAAPWSKDVGRVLRELGTDGARGLTPAQAEQRRAQCGFNELDKQPGTPVWKLIAEQFNDTLVKVCAWGAGRGLGGGCGARAK